MHWSKCCLDNFDSYPDTDTLHLGSLVILYQQKFTIQQQRCSGGGEETHYLHYINEKYLNLHNSLWQSISCEYWVKPLWRVPETSKEWRNPPFNFQKRIRIGGTRNNEQWQSDPQLKAAVSGLHERKTRGKLEPRTQQAPPPSPLMMIEVWLDHLRHVTCKYWLKMSRCLCLHI